MFKKELEKAEEAAQEIASRRVSVRSRLKLAKGKVGFAAEGKVDLAAVSKMAGQ